MGTPCEFSPVGVVTYDLDRESGKLLAQWAFSAQAGVEVICEGVATPIDQGETKTDFPGKYEIIYKNPNGKEDPPWDLSIEQRGELYDLTWSKEGQVHYHGIGFLSGEQLVCGWRA